MNMKNDDEKFESFLREYRPRALEPLHIEQQERTRRRQFVFGSLVAAAAAALVVAMFTISNPSRWTHLPKDTEAPASAEQLINQQPLTIGKANALLARAPSVKAAVDQMAFKSQTTQLSKGKHSALAVLSQENIKL